MLILVTDRRAFGESLASRLLQSGIFSLRASHDAASFLCEAKDCGGVLLDGAASPQKSEALCRELRTRYPELPIALLLPKGYLPSSPADRFLREGEEEMTDALLDFCHTLCGWPTGEMSTFSLTVGKDPTGTRYMGYPLPLSPREHVLLRCLFYRAPRLTSCDDLLSLCYPTDPPTAASLSVTVSAINRRASAIDPRPLIVNVYGKGYRLRRGILD